MSFNETRWIEPPCLKYPYEFYQNHDLHIKDKILMTVDCTKCQQEMCQKCLGDGYGQDGLECGFCLNGFSL